MVMRHADRSLLLDFTPLVSGAVARPAIVVAVVLLALPAGSTLDRSSIEAWV
jgi:hypothetical protein